MKRRTKYPVKKMIYLEMITLAVLLVAAVLIASHRDKDSPKKEYKPKASADQAVFNEDTPTSATEETKIVPDWKTYPEDRKITAKQYFVYDFNEAKFLSQSGKETDRVYPASITKLFTAYTICDTMIVSPNQIFTVTQDVLDLVAYGSSVAGLKAGDKLTALQLMESMLICSGNDAAYVLAYEAGKAFADQQSIQPADAIKRFVQEMNSLAKKKGMTDTNFVNPDGIHDPNHYTTVHDLVILGKLCPLYQSIMNPVSVPEADIQLHGETVVWKNTNELINPKSPYYCRYAIGLKTGQTPNAGSCLLSFFHLKNERYLLIGVFGCPETEDRFDDTLQLFNQVVLE